jgi:hypothetical protein
MTTAAPILSTDPTTLTFADGDSLDCLYVVVDGRSDRHVADFLAHWHARCDVTELDWQAVRRPRTALVGLELTHTCGNAELEEKRLRLIFDVERDAAALERLVETEALVVGTRAYGSFANSMAAYGVDGSAVQAAVRAAKRGLAELLTAAS